MVYVMAFPCQGSRKTNLHLTRSTVLTNDGWEFNRVDYCPVEKHNAPGGHVPSDEPTDVWVQPYMTEQRGHQISVGISQDVQHGFWTFCHRTKCGDWVNVIFQSLCSFDTSVRAIPCMLLKVFFMCHCFTKKAHFSKGQWFFFFFFLGFSFVGSVLNCISKSYSTVRCLWCTNSFWRAI